MLVSVSNSSINSLIVVPHQARIYEGSEPIQFFAIFQSFIVFKVCEFTNMNRAT